MKKLEQIIEKYLLPLANLISRSKEINAIKDGMLQVMPLMLTGSLMLIIANFPYIEKVFPNTDLWYFFGKGYSATLGIAALIALITIAYNYAIALGSEGMYGSIIAITSYFVLTNDVVTQGQETIFGVIPTSAFGGTALITVILIAILSVRIYNLLEKKKITIKMPSQVPPNVSKSFSSLIPIIIIVFLMLGLRELVALTSYDTLQMLIYTLLTKSLSGLVNYKYSIVLISMIGSFLWFFGIHGGIIVLSVFGPIMDSMMIANTDALAAGSELPYVATSVFYNNYCVIGAMGILGAVCASVIVGRSKLTKSVSKMSIIPAIFNIQEPFHFGLPTFMNPVLFIPYVFITPIITFIAYTFVEIGFSPVPVLNVPWTTPIFISGFISTNYNIMGVVTQAILFALTVLMWIPFIRVVDNMNLKKEKDLETTKAA